MPRASNTANSSRTRSPTGHGVNKPEQTPGETRGAAADDVTASALTDAVRAVRERHGGVEVGLE